MNATIKICGLKDHDAIHAAIDCGTNFLGFVCDYPKSPRNLSPFQLKEIISKIKKSNSSKVAVTVDPNDNLIDAIKDSVDYIQLHGSESNNRVLEIKKKFKLKIIKAIKITTEKDFQQINQYPDADDLLLDTPGMEKSELFNFELLKNKNISSYFLAGGINIDNVEQALQYTAKLDISSSLESKPGIKDLEKIKKFMNKVKKYA